MSAQRAEDPVVVATVGPSSFRRVAELVEAGAGALRLNGSHMTSAELGEAVETLRAEHGQVPIIVDLQGAKMRLGRFPPRRFRRGDPARFQLATEGDARGPIPVPHPELFRAAHEGDVLGCHDEGMRFAVTETAPDALWARAQSEGTLEARKGMHLQPHPVELEGLCRTDGEQLARVADAEHLSFAYSFMKDGREAAWVRERAPGRPVIGKIERCEALERLDSIAGAVDQLWICRGDLGAELGDTELARAVSTIGPARLDVPVLMAGQVLEHLTEHAWPTRSEICHLYDLLGRGYAGIVLSDETAIGVDPVRAVATAVRLVRAWS